MDLQVTGFATGARVVPWARSVFRRDESGTVTITFGVLVIPILALLIGAIDYSRALSVQFSLQQSADAAVEAAADNLLVSTAKARTAFAANFKANLPERLRNTQYDLRLDQDKGTVKVDMKKPVPTTIMSLIGINAFTVAVNAKAQRVQQGVPLGISNGPVHADVPREVRDAQAQLRDALAEAQRRGAPINMPSEAELRRMGEQLKQRLGR